MESKVKPIPEGYHSLTPYLIYKNASKAIDFYKKVFQAKEIFRMDKDNKISHAEIKIGDSNLMMADEHPEINAVAPVGETRSSTMMLYVENVDEVFAKAIAAGAKEIRPVKNEFYGDRMCTVQDPFGHNWHIATHIEDVTKEEMEKRSALKK